MSHFNRRLFLQASAALGSLFASGVRQVARAATEHVDAPIVDRVVLPVSRCVSLTEQGLASLRQAFAGDPIASGNCGPL
jgi:hypothetical protein